VINFRYHVVSLAAVFLALAVGLIVGTAAANGPVTDSLKARYDEVSATNQQLRDEVNQQNTDLQKAGDFATDIAPAYLAGKLTGKRVLVLSLEGNGNDVDKTVSAIYTFLGDAGAKVTGTVKIREKFGAPSSKAQLLDLAESSAPPSVSGALPNQSDGVDSSAALLAAILVGKTGTAPVDGVRQVLSAYESQGYLSVDGDFAAPAEATVLVAGVPTTGKDAKDRAAAALTVINRFDQAGRSLVVAGLAPGGPVQAVRGDSALAKNVSTVDNADTAQGQVAAILALVDRVNGRAVGHYGTGDGASSLIPKPASTQNGS
jgi:hypothetical protein